MLDLEASVIGGMDKAMLDLEVEEQAPDHRLIGHRTVAVHKVGTFGCNLLELNCRLLDSFLDSLVLVLDSFVPVVPIVVLVELTSVQMLGLGSKELLRVQSWMAIGMILTVDEPSSGGLESWLGVRSEDVRYEDVRYEGVRYEDVRYEDVRYEDVRVQGDYLDLEMDVREEASWLEECREVVVFDVGDHEHGTH